MFSQKVSVVIPVFNAEAVLVPLVERVAAALQGNCPAFEVVLVDDESKDGSWQVIEKLATQYDWLAGARLKHNLGQYAAILVGLRFARYPVAITMDDDLQHPPESIPQLLAALTDDVDLVYAGPKGDIKMSTYRIIASAIKYALAIAGGALFLLRLRSFRAIRTSIYPWTHLSIHRGLALDGLLKAAKPRVKEIDVAYHDRLVGVSSYNFRRSSQLAYRIWRSTRISLPEEKIATCPPILSVVGWLKDSPLAQ